MPTPLTRRIAVIDDDAVFVDLMRDLLGEGEGYDVISTGRWPHSFEFIKDSQPDLVILDLMLGRDQVGLGVLQLLREDPTTTKIPVILCSAATRALRECKCHMNGDTRVEIVAKPFDVDQLLGTIERLLSRSSGNGSTEGARRPRDG